MNAISTEIQIQRIRLIRATNKANLLNQLNKSSKFSRGFNHRRSYSEWPSGSHLLTFLAKSKQIQRDFGESRLFDNEINAYYNRNLYLENRGEQDDFCEEDRISDEKCDEPFDFSTNKGKKRTKLPKTSRFQKSSIANFRRVNSLSENNNDELDASIGRQISSNRTVIRSDVISTSNNEIDDQREMYDNYDDEIYGNGYVISEKEEDSDEKCQEIISVIERDSHHEQVTEREFGLLRNNEESQEDFVSENQEEMENESTLRTPVLTRHRSQEFLTPPLHMISSYPSIHGQMIDISKNQNIIDSNQQSLVFDIKAPETLFNFPGKMTHSAMKSDNDNIIRNNHTSLIRFEKKIPPNMIQSDNKLFPIQADYSPVLKQARGALVPRPTTLEHLQTENISKSEVLSQESSSLLDESFSREVVEHMVNINSANFDKIYLHQWKIPERPTVQSKLFNPLGPNLRPRIRILRSCPAHLDSVRRVAFIPLASDNTLLVSAGDDCLVKLWKMKVDITNDKEEKIESAPFLDKKQSFPSKYHQKSQLEFSQRISGVDVIPLEVFREHTSPIISLCRPTEEVESRSSLFFTGDSSGYVTCFSIKGNRLNVDKRFKTGTEPVWSLAFSGPNHLLTSCPNKIKLFNTLKSTYKQEAFVCSSHTRFFGHLDFLSDSNFVVHSFSAKTLKNEFLGFDLFKEKESWSMHSKQGFSNLFRAVPRYSMLLSANEDRSVSIHDLREKDQVRSFVAHSEPVTALDVRVDRHLLVTAGVDSSVRLWDLRTLRCFNEISAHRRKYDDSIFDVRFDPSAQLIASAGADSFVKIFQF